MRVEILYFAVLRERVGRDQETLALPASATVAQAVAELRARHPAIAPLLDRVQLAVNRQMIDPSHPLTEGDELALIPPVAGGAGPRKIAVVDLPISLADVVACVEGPEQGAVATFSGHVRRQGQQPNVVRLEYEAYVAMAEEVLAALAMEIESEWPGVRVAIHHRIGTLAVGEVAVAIAVSAPHRNAAFEACRAAIDRLKVRAPIWKKEVGEDGAVWIGLGP